MDEKQLESIKESVKEYINYINKQNDTNLVTLNYGMEIILSCLCEHKVISKNNCLKLKRYIKKVIQGEI
jgi:accessory gene regulator protein AgrB